MRAVINEGTVTAAASRLHRTQPAVSRLLAQLENDIGFAIFRRRGRRLLPTPEGLTFYRETERAFAALAEVESIAGDISKRRDAPLRVIAQSHMVHGLMHEALADFCVERPSFRFAVEIWQEEYISHWIANRLFDVGFSPQRADHPAIITELLIRAPLLVVLPSSHRLARSRRVNAAQLAEDQVVAVRPGAPLRQHLDGFFASGATAPLIRGETSSAVSACQLASKGLGITVTDPFVAHLFANDPSVVFRHVSPPREMEYLVLRAAGYGERPVAEQFVSCVRDTARRVIDRVLSRAAEGRTTRQARTRPPRS